jgi:type I restriction enzyme S subunit
MSTAAESGHKYHGYRATKASNVAWLGEVPQHWDVLRLKYTAELVNEKVNGAASELPYTGLEHIESWTGKRLTTEAETSSDGQATVYRAGDVLFGKLRPYLAKSYAAQGDGICTGELLVLRPKTLVQGFLRDYLLNPSFISIVDSSTYGAKMPRASWEFIGNLPALVPPLDEQRAIARFLDRETARIDALIEKKRRQIELLHEKRIALISHAVTKGLDPRAPMEDSGIDWLGRIPRSWRVLQFRRVIRALEQGWSPVAEEREAEADEWAVLKISAVAQGRFRPREHKALPPGLEPEARYEVRPGDLLLTRSNTPERVGDACFVPETRHRLLMSDLIYRVHLDQRRCLHPFACYWLISRPGRAAIEADARGTSGSMVKIAQSHIRAWPILVPPLDEQRAIVQQLDHEMSRIDGIVDKIEASIDLLREYRTALISAAVTGKIDVRKEVA